jgi:Guanosine polyphosphate pyrophosphohydrolases/synthetases
MKMNVMMNFVKERHGKQTRKQGTPYYLHPFAVAEILKSKGFGEDYQFAGLGHDLLEDTKTTYEEILNLANEKIAKAIVLVTKEENYNMEEYINRINQNEIAKAVKLADRLHNLSEAHVASIKWIEKYILETKTWYLDMAKDTPFEKELLELVKSLEKQIRDEKNKQRKKEN